MTDLNVLKTVNMAFYTVVGTNYLPSMFMIKKSTSNHLAALRKLNFQQEHHT